MTASAIVAASVGGARPTPDAEPDAWPDHPTLPGVPDPDPIPTEVYPDFLRRQIVSVSLAYQVPADMPALFAIVCLSAACAGRFHTSVRTGWREPATVYGTAISESATRKSAVTRAMKDPLVEKETRRIRELHPARKRAEDRVALAEKRLREAIQQGAGDDDTARLMEDARGELEAAQREVPADGRLLVSDVTSEALVVRMAAQGGHAAVIEPEPGFLQVAAGRYSNDAHLDEIKKAHDGETITCDRIGRESVRITNPALTLGLCVQPGVLEELPHNKSFRLEGVLARFLWVKPPHLLGQRLTGADVPPLDTAAARAYGAVLWRLMDLPTTADGEPTILALTREARGVLYEFEAEVETELGDGGRFESIRDWAGKAVGHAVRIASLLALARQAHEGAAVGSPVDAESVTSAVAIVRALSTHALVVLGTRSDSHVANLSYLLKRLASLPPGSTERELREASRGRESIQADRATVQCLVDDLVELGCVRRVASKRHGGPGRPPTDVLELHPALIVERRL